MLRLGIVQKHCTGMFLVSAISMADMCAERVQMEINAAKTTHDHMPKGLKLQSLFLCLIQAVSRAVFHGNF